MKTVNQKKATSPEPVAHIELPADQAAVGAIITRCISKLTREVFQPEPLYHANVAVPIIRTRLEELRIKQDEVRVAVAIWLFHLFTGKYPQLHHIVEIFSKISIRPPQGVANGFITGLVQRNILQTPAKDHYALADEFAAQTTLNL